MEKIKEIITGAKSGWGKISTKKKITLVSILVLVLIFATGFTLFSKRVNYAVLFRNLDFKDAGNIINDLESKKINYKLENGGQDILIDEKHVDKYRLQLAMDGMMPENSTGFEIFDNIGIMATDDDRKIMYHRALTGELQRSIMSLSAVNAAKVHLMIPEKTIFELESKESTASVIIDLKPSQRISNDMIKGIAALISGAVDNLPEKNVQIIDSKGNLLSSFLQQDDSNSSFGTIDKYQKIQEEFEKKVESNVYKLLGSAFGQDKIKISVYAELDFDAEETTTISYDNPVIKSEEIRATGSGSSRNVGGGNIDDSISNVMSGYSGDNSTFERSVENELNTETKIIIKAPGKVKKLTTSVLYDGDLSETNIGKIQNIVATATGYDSERGDLISVEGISFDKSYDEVIAKEMEEIRLQEEKNKTIFDKYGIYISWGLRFIGLIIFLILISKLISNMDGKGQMQTKRELANSMDIDIHQVFDINDDVLEIKTDAKQSKAEKYAKDNPEVAADLIKAWLKD